MSTSRYSSLIRDRMVREDPDHAYEPEFYERFATEAGWYTGR